MILKYVRYLGGFSALNLEHKEKNILLCFIMNVLASVWKSSRIIEK